MQTYAWAFSRSYGWNEHIHSTTQPLQSTPIRDSPQHITKGKFPSMKTMTKVIEGVGVEHGKILMVFGDEQGNNVISNMQAYYIYTSR